MIININQSLLNPYLANLSISSLSLADVFHEEIVLILVGNTDQVRTESETLIPAILNFPIVLQQEITVTTVFSPVSRAI